MKAWVVAPMVSQMDMGQPVVRLVASGSNRVHLLAEEHGGSHHRRTLQTADGDSPTVRALVALGGAPARALRLVQHPVGATPVLQGVAVRHQAVGVRLLVVGGEPALVLPLVLLEHGARQAQQEDLGATRVHNKVAGMYDLDKPHPSPAHLSITRPACTAVLGSRLRETFSV